MRYTAAVLFGIMSLSFTSYGQPTVDGNLDPNEFDRRREANEIDGRDGYWEANLLGGNYLVALASISAVSRHKYILDGAVVVDEVTVDTTGQALARFYFITPIDVSGPGTAAAEAAEKAVALVDGAARRAGTQSQDMVIKKYPLTTHSKCIEYRILSEEQLNALFSSVKSAWVMGRGRVFNGQ